MSDELTFHSVDSRGCGQGESSPTAEVLSDSPDSSSLGGVDQPPPTRAIKTASYRRGRKSSNALWAGYGHTLTQDRYNFIVHHPASCRSTPTYFTTKSSVYWELTHPRNCGLRLSVEDTMVLNRLPDHPWEAT